MILNTCNKTEKPPNPNKKEHKIIEIEIVLIGILAAKLTPFVNSTIPDKTGLIKSNGSPKNEKTGESKLDNPSNKWL